MTDPLETLVASYAAILIQEGRCPIEAWQRAEESTSRLLDDLERQGAPVAAFLRRVKVYHLRSRGVTATDICGRLGIAVRTVHKDYKSEMMRRRKLALVA